MALAIDILTLFPGMFAGPFSESIVGRAVRAGHVQLAVHDIRQFAVDRHRTVDDAPFGGGAGMVMKPVPLAGAIRSVAGHQPRPVVIYLSPDGVPFDQQYAAGLAGLTRFVLVCGHYEGIDERVRTSLIDRELSIGDYVLTGGELAAMVVVDAVVRLVPGVIRAESTAEESHSDGLLEYPHYTRPASWEGQEVPEVLRSGHHGAVARWRRHQRLERTLARRPELLARATLDAADRRHLAQLGWSPVTE
jgi:tRNA (guanine37-N1)-methyltransferase